MRVQVQVQVNPQTEVTKRSSWSFTEEKCLIAAFKEYYDRLESTKNCQGRKSIWEDTLKLFQSMCFDNGVDSEKSLVQLKEKWKKYKSVCDNNNRTGREWNPYIDLRRMTREFWSSPQISGRSSTTTPRICCVCVRKTRGHICFQKIGFNSVLLFQRKKKWRVYLIAAKRHFKWSWILFWTLKYRVL